MMKHELDSKAAEYLQEAFDLGLDETLDSIRLWTRKRIEDVVDRMNEEDLFDFIHDQIDDRLCQMKDFDEVYSHLTLTEVLECCKDMDLDAVYFNSDTCESGNDMMDLIALDYDEVVDRIIDDGLYYISDFTEILEDQEYVSSKVSEEYKIYDKAYVLFKMAMKQDAKAIMATLWAINQD